MLSIDFYESGIGDTIVITFPDGGIGVVDGHPGSGQRAPLLQITQASPIHFLCLTHPHEDHGRELVSLAENHPNIHAFWHTVSDWNWFFQSIQLVDTFPSGMREFVLAERKAYATCFIKLFHAIKHRNIQRRRLHANIQFAEIAGVEVHCIGPEEDVQNRFVDAHQRRVEQGSHTLPDPNQISAILALRYGNVVILLGSDALKGNWEPAAERYFKLKLPKARILKVPHHGASNAFGAVRSRHNYLDLCDGDLPAHAILFAGDSKHPDERVFAALRQKTQLRCLGNGLFSKPANPLNLMIPRARSPIAVPVCNPRIGIQVSETGETTVVEGNRCARCA